MTDLKITRLCAEAMGLEFKVAQELYCSWNAPLEIWTKDGSYNPLYDDAEAMALVKKLGIEIHCRTDRNGWYVGIVDSDGMTPDGDLNRAICLCVAAMQQAKGAK